MDKIKCSTCLGSRLNRESMHYYIDSIKSYDNYILNNSSKMRKVPKFATDVKIKRRLLNEISI